jgi:hypothetical protein
MTIVRLEGLGKLKNPMTSLGIAIYKIKPSEYGRKCCVLVNAVNSAANLGVSENVEIS